MVRNKWGFSSRKTFFLILVLGIAIGLAGCVTGQHARRQADLSKEKVSAPGRYSGYSFPKYRDVQTTSFYLTMRDGVKIAVDLHLPKGLPDSEKIPTILYQTRYIRSLEYKWPFSLKRAPTEVAKSIRFFVSYGYAWVSIDARGSAASFGSRPYELPADEVKDGGEIVNWIIRQPWSDGKVGSFGTSYTGSTSEFLLVNNHPAVKAVAPRFSFFDVYNDIGFPGGIHQTWFTETWAAGNHAIDTNTITAKYGPKVRMMVKGIKPVDDDKDGSLLAAAIRDHANNNDVHKEALGVTFRDDVSPSGVGTADMMSSSSFVDKLESSGAAIYFYSGWYDGAYQRAAIEKYLTLENSKKLIIGPWDHGGRHGISPWGTSHKPEFNHNLEMLRFFDYHLKGIRNGIMEEKPIYYFTMGEEKWKSADTWPLPNQQLRTLYFSSDAGLSETKPSDDAGHDTYIVDYSAGTGDIAHWNSLTGPRGDVVWGYPNRTEDDGKLLRYTGAPLGEDMEVTGHPIVKLFVTSTADDGNFFVYLEDVDPAGHVTYVTEGELRALHRKVSDEKPPYWIPDPYHTFKKKDAEPLVPGEVAELTFDLLPTSYLFKKGHSMRVAIAGADKDHFALLKTDPPPTLEFQRNAAHASAIDLPIIPR
ncbi:CocE/NonD family hydrolase [Candidatus Poribacteria bacterium]|nr:CocE/NonD family hydrolase [Candidatus Poribacteria bacterium]